MIENALIMFALSVFADTTRGQETSRAPSRAQQDFHTANERALSGAHDDAIRLYELLLGQGIRNEDLYYNLGNVQAERGHLVDAIVSYERAIRLAPSDQDARANLTAVRSRLLADGREKRETEEHAAVSLADFLDPIVAPLPVEACAWITLASDLLLFGALFVRRRSTREGARRATLAIAISALSLFIGAGGALLGHAIVSHDPRAVLIETVDLREGPHPRYESRTRAAHGARVRVLREDADWSEILLQDGQTGWVPANVVVRV